MGALTATQNIAVNVKARANNRAPVAVGTIGSQTVSVGGSAATVNVSSNFRDADGETLTYTASSSDKAKATVSASGSTVSIAPVAEGKATITVTATDPSEATATQTIAVTVNPKGLRTDSGGNHFRADGDDGREWQIPEPGQLLQQ